MRFRQIVNENLSPEQILRKYFDIRAEGSTDIKAPSGVYEFTPDGVNIVEDAYLKQKFAHTITELPIKFNKVGISFAVNNALNLQSLNNFPNRVFHLNIFNAPLTKLISNTGDISCSSLLIGVAPITDFADSSIVLAGESSVKITGCKKLTSLRGLRFEIIDEITINDCPMFVDDLATDPNIRSIFIRGMSSNDMPLINGFISGKLKFGPGTSETAKIYKKYQDQGPEHVTKLIRELRAAGFKNATSM